MAPSLKSRIYMLGLPRSIWVGSCYYGDRGEHYLGSHSLELLTQGPEDPLDRHQFSFLQFVIAYLEDQ